MTQTHQPTNIPVKVYSESKHGVPKYEHLYDSGMDVRANITNEEGCVVIGAGMTVIVPTGLFVSVPPGFEIQARPRSGLSLKTPIRIANSVGTIDSPYRGEIGIIVWNSGNAPLTVVDGERIAQLVLAPVFICDWNIVSSKADLSDTTRGEGGFGSTGK